MRIAILLSLFLFWGCKTASKKNNSADQQASASPDSCLQFSKFDPLPNVTAKQLQVSSISVRPGGTLLKATTIDIASTSQTVPDIFYYEACSLGKTDNCINGNTVNGTDTNPYFPSGKYSVYARACVFENRAPNKSGFTAIPLAEGPTVYCGSPSDYKTSTNSNSSVDPTEKNAYDLNQKKKKLAWQIYNIIKSQQSSPSAQNDNTYAVSKQTIIDMGPGIFSEAVSGLLLDIYTTASQNPPPSSSDSSSCLTLNKLNSIKQTLDTQSLQLADTSSSSGDAKVDERYAAYALFAVGGTLAIVGTTAAVIVHQFRSKYPWKDLLFSVNFQKYSDKLPTMLTKERPISALTKEEQAKVAEWQKEIDSIEKYKPIAAMTGTTIEYLESKPLDQILDDMQKVADGKISKDAVAFTDSAMTEYTYQEIFGDVKITPGTPELNAIGKALKAQNRLAPADEKNFMVAKPIVTEIWNAEDFKAGLASLQEAHKNGLLVKSKTGVLQHTATIAAEGPLDRAFKSTNANATSIEKMRRGLLVVDHGEVTDKFTHAGASGARTAITIAVMAAVPGAALMAGSLLLAGQEDPLTKPTVELIKVLQQQNR